MRRKPLCILFSLLAAAAVAGRFVLYFTSIDPTTGFYTASARVAGLISSLVFVVGLVLCLLLFRCLSEPKAGVLGRAPDLAIVSFGMAVALVFDTIASLVRGTADSPLRDGIAAIFALLAAVYFVCSGVDYLRGERRTPGLLYGAAPLWAAVKLVIFYTKFHGVVYISEGVLEVFALALTMMFWLYHTRMITGLNPARATQWGYGFGIAAAAACAMVTLPRMAAGLMGRTELTTHGADLEITWLVSILYIAVFLIRYHITSVQSPWSPVADEQAETSTLEDGDPRAQENQPEDVVAPIEGTEETPDAVPTQVDSAKLDDRIDRMVSELLLEQEEKEIATSDEPLD